MLNSHNDGYDNHQQVGFDDTEDDDDIVAQDVDEYIGK